MLVEYSLLTLNLAFAGLLNKPAEFSGVGLGGLTSSIVVLTVGLGMCGGTDTLVSQAYGRKDYAYCGVCLNTSRLCLFAVYLIQAVILCLSYKIFVFVGQPLESSFYAWQYIMVCLPGFFFLLQFESMRRYLLAIGIYLPGVIIIAVTLVLHTVCLYVFTIALEYGVIGIGISTSISFTSNFMLIALYMQCHSDPVVRGSWNILDPMITQCVPNYLRYGISACVAMFLSWCPSELTVAYGGLLGVIELSSASIFNGILLIFNGVHCCAKDLIN